MDKSALGAIMVAQTKDYSGVNQGSSNGTDEKLRSSGYVLKAETQQDLLNDLM